MKTSRKKPVELAKPRPQTPHVIGGISLLVTVNVCVNLCIIMCGCLRYPSQQAQREFEYDSMRPRCDYIQFVIAKTTRIVLAEVDPSCKILRVCDVG